jgi:hypothetical protein
MTSGDFNVKDLKELNPTDSRLSLLPVILAKATSSFTDRSYLLSY